jgi:serine/threonine protein phosphatase PrpC
VHETSGIHGADAGDDARAKARVSGSRARMWSVGQRSETGYVRSENQDRMSWIRASAADVFVVSDGMGGHAGGAAAATLTVEVLQDELQSLDTLTHADQVLVRALQAANSAVHTRGQTPNPAFMGMGATAVVLLAAGKRIMVAHVGDSRAYRLDRRGVLHRLTKDHSVVQRMIDAGTLTVQEARHHPDASVLARALGQAPRVSVDVCDWITLRSGELCMLCSDGLCGYVDDIAIASVMSEGGTPQAIADRLVRLALDAGGEDNVTVQVLRYGDALRVNWQRWFGHGALALSALCTAAAAMVWAGWAGFGPAPDRVSSHAEKAPGPAPMQANALGNAASTAGSAAARAGESAAASAPRAATSLDAAITALERSRQAATERFRQDDAQLAQKLAALRKERDALEGGAAARGAPGALPLSKEASAVIQASTPGANDTAVSADAGQGVNKTPGASAPKASNIAPKARAHSGAGHGTVVAGASKHTPKHAQRPTPTTVTHDEPASAADAGSRPQSADSDRQPVEIKQ